VDILDFFEMDEAKRRRTRVAAYLLELRRDSGYRRVALSPLRYAGGKSRAVGLILERLPRGPGAEVVSPFFGGGSAELALASLGFEVRGYDIFEMLTNYWRHQLRRPRALREELARLRPDRKTFRLVRRILLHYWEKTHPEFDYETRRDYPLTEEQRTLLDGDPLRRAAYYYYNHQLSYGPMFLGWPSSVYLDKGRYAGILERVGSFRAPRVTVEQADFGVALRRHPDALALCDPPYHLGEGSTLFKGLYPNSNFAFHHEGFDHARLAESLRGHPGGFALTYNDCPAVRELYEGFELRTLRWQYSFGQGETRIGENRSSGEESSNVKDSHEILVVGPPRG